MTKFKHYWVTYTGMLADGETEAAPSSEEARTFTGEVTRNLQTHHAVGSPAILSYGDGTVILSSRVEALTGGGALDIARAAFTEAIQNAGGACDFPTEEHPSWGVARLVKFGEGTVHELDDPDGSADGPEKKPKTAKKKVAAA